LLAKVIEKELEDGIELIDHLCYATEVNRFVLGWCIVVTQATLRRQIRKIVENILGSIVVLREIIRLLLPDDDVKWVEIK
jgi:hypothetical protein